jgi:hypothetical protein
MEQLHAATQQNLAECVFSQVKSFAVQQISVHFEQLMSEAMIPATYVRL